MAGVAAHMTIQTPRRAEGLSARDDDPVANATMPQTNQWGQESDPADYIRAATRERARPGEAHPWPSRPSRAPDQRQCIGPVGLAGDALAQRRFGVLGPEQ